MSLKFRRYLYIFFILIFLIAVPLLSLYAYGYKISLSNMLKGNFFIQKTGLLVLDSYPQGARIFINGKPRQFLLKNIFRNSDDFVTTPAKIKNLTPGDYIIRLEKAGYWPWEKRLHVEAGVATYAEDISLFRDNLPTLAVNDSITNLAFSPGNDILAYYNNSGMYIVNLKNEEKTRIIDTPEKFYASSTDPIDNPLAWSKDGSRLLFDDYLIDVRSDFAVLDESNRSLVNGNNLKWDITSANKFYFQALHELDTVDIDTHSTSTVIKAEGYMNYLVRGDFVHIIKEHSNATNISTFNRNSQLQSSINIPYSCCYEFINTESSFLNLYDSKFKMLYLINPFQEIDPLRESINNVVYSAWIDNNRLLYANELEIWLYNLGLNKKTLLTRISEGITGIIWHPSNNYVIYSTEKSLNVIEMDDREKRIITKLVNLDNIKWLNMSKKGDALYFYAQIGNQEGVYKLNIQ